MLCKLGQVWYPLKWLAQKHGGKGDGISVGALFEEERERGKSERERGVERYTNSDRRTRQAEGGGQTLLSGEDKVTPLFFLLIVIGLFSLAGLRTTGSVGYNDIAYSDMCLD